MCHAPSIMTSRPRISIDMTSPFASRCARALVVLALLSGCGETPPAQPVTTTTAGGQVIAPPADQVANRGNALVRAVHAIPGGAAVDLFADGRKAFPGISFQTVTPYTELPGSRTPFVVRPAGMDTAAPLAEQSEGLSNGRHYTVVVSSGEGGEAAVVRIVADDLRPPDAKTARVRLIHATPDAGALDVHLQGRRAPLYENITFGGRADYVVVEPLSAGIEIRQHGLTDLMASLPQVTIAPGRNYTFVLTGRARSGTLEVIAIEDYLGAP